jgi:hypothetical protein
MILLFEVSEKPIVNFQFSKFNVMENFIPWQMVLP